MALLSFFYVLFLVSGLFFFLSASLIDSTLLSLLVRCNHNILQDASLSYGRETTYSNDEESIVRRTNFEPKKTASALQYVSSI